MSNQSGDVSGGPRTNRRPSRGRSRDLFSRAVIPANLIHIAQVHATVWLDHLEATVVSFSLGSSNEIEVHSHSPERHIHHRTPS